MFCILLIFHFQECNRSSEHDVKSVGMALSGIPKEIEFQETGQLNLKYYFGSIPFRFYWQVQEDANELGETLVMPLLIALKIAHDRERELLEVIRQKDEEIQDYRRQDVPLLNSRFNRIHVNCSIASFGPFNYRIPRDKVIPREAKEEKDGMGCFSRFWSGGESSSGFVSGSDLR